MTDLHWLAATCIFTGLSWLPYIFNRITGMGLKDALGNPSPDDKPLAAWAARAKAAHINSIENLVLFAPLLLIVHAMGLSGATTLLLAQVYFFARVAHYIIYVMGIPVVRTLTFTVGFIATLVMGGVIFGFIT